MSTIHRNKVPCKLVGAGQSASLSLEGVAGGVVRKGMKLLAPDTKPTAALYFQVSNATTTSRFFVVAIVLPSPQCP